MKRNAYFDFLRGLAIIMVVGIHCYPAKDATVLQLLFRQFIHCAVPLFLAISGYFLGKKQIETWEQYAIFIKKQVLKVYIPMIIFSIPWIVFNIYIGKNVISTILLALIGGISIFYFIPLIIQYYLLLPLLMKCTNTHCKIGFFSTLAITLLSTGIIVYLQHIRCMDLPLILSVAPFPVMIIFYYIGVMYACVNPVKIEFRSRYLLMATFITLPLCMFEIYILYPYGHVVSGMKVSTQLLAVIIILFLFKPSLQVHYEPVSKLIFFKLLQFMGRVSFFIYLTHLLYKVLFDYFIHIDNWYVNWIIIVSISTIIAFITQKNIPFKFHKYIGI